MLKKTIFSILCLFWVIWAWSDCIFKITNYADTVVIIQVGFYGGESAIMSVDATSNKSIRIRNVSGCNSITAAGFGVTYANLVGKQSSGGWVYAPAARMIRAVGSSSGSQNMVLGIAPSGEKLVLFNNTSPSADSFEVRIENAGRNISRQLGSMD